ncbi:MAG: YciI family protein [bacterium]
MLIRKSDADTEAGVIPAEEFFVEMQRYSEEMARAGVFVQGEGLMASAKGARVRLRRGKPTVTDGPFTETKELIAGFTMINVASRDEAIAWALKWPAIDREADVEIRQLFDPEDFGDNFTPELREQGARLREQAAAKR